MTPADLADAVRGAAAAAVEAGELTGEVPAEVSVERPKNPEHGDYATNIALRMAKGAGLPPRAVAEVVAGRLRTVDGVDSVDVAGPGFLNITLAAGSLGELARTIVSAGYDYGRATGLTGQTLNLEFVSANPTGPVHIGAVRWAAVGDALARLLEASGAAVTREYYFNDAGSQIERFARTLREVANGRPVPEDGYAGPYIDDIAKAVVDANPGILDLPPDEQQEIFRRDGVEQMFAEIRTSLAEFGVVFDVYFNERDLHARAMDAALERLRAGGHVFEADGATWLRTTDFGDDRDRPVVRSNGEWTYFAADCAYYLNKRERGFDRVVIMLGADHHGYIGRMRAMVRCFGDDPDATLEILLGQMVNLVKDGEPVRMSKRAGDIVVLADLVDAIGADAARYALVRYSVEQTIDLDLDVWARAGNDNPVYYVKYAHARLASLQRNAAELGIERTAGADLTLLDHDREVALLAALGEYPRIVAAAAELRAPHRVAHYLESLAGTYHRFYDACRVLPMGDEPATPLTDARLWLCEATRIVLANGLGLLGVSAPQRM